ncbi:MAG: ABC transporter ATP-binding protein, partial [Chloroflexi bacterium]
MSFVLSVNQTGKSYGPLTILQNVSFILNRGDRVGLVGANGSGKSTLLQIIAGDLEPDSGSCSIPPTITTGYLPQRPPDAGERSLADLIRDSVGELRVLEERLRTLE